MTTKVTLDMEKCCGYGICAEICPSVFKLDDRGICLRRLRRRAGGRGGCRPGRRPTPAPSS
uniref:Ferredoxin n=1 Tax=Janibacter limosus TaxID=53458 RepID=A0AC61U5N6_9MICO|nr:ferredoxin [Janibacter limosus]